MKAVPKALTTDITIIPPAATAMFLSATGVPIRKRLPRLSIWGRREPLLNRSWGVREKIELQWDFKSRDYNKEGTIVIKVEPIYEEREQIILQEPYEILKAPEIVIEPKIIEKE